MIPTTYCHYFDGLLWRQNANLARVWSSEMRSTAARMTLLLHSSGDGGMIADIHQTDRTLTVPSLHIITQDLLWMCTAVTLTSQEWWRPVSHSIYMASLHTTLFMVYSLCLTWTRTCMAQPSHFMVLWSNRQF